MSTHTPDHEPDLPQQGDGGHSANPQPDTETPAGQASPVAPAAHEPLAPPVPQAAPVPQAGAESLGLQSEPVVQTPVAPGDAGPRGLAIAALVLGIAGLVLVWLPFLAVVALPAAIVGLILGIIAMRKGQPKGLALTGVILSGVAILISVISVVVVLIGLALLGGSGALAP